MDVKDVRKKIKEIEEKYYLDDFEAAYSLENGLYLRVLTSISKDPTNAHELAKAAIKTQKIPFSRYTA